MPLEIKASAEDLLKDLKKIPENLDVAKRSGLAGVGFLVSSETKNFLRTSRGRVDRKRLSRFGNKFYIRRGAFGANPPQGVKKVLKPRGKGPRVPFRSFSRFPRYIVEDEEVQVGFAVANRPKQFLPSLEKTIARIQEGERTKVTPEMRRLYGATRKFTDSENPRPGFDFFPLKKSTKEIVSKPFDIEGPVVNKTKSQVYPIFKQRFEKKLKKINGLVESE
jgi:hypothetical protein